MEGSRDSGIDRLLSRVKPRWDEKRHERVFAAILQRIRAEETGDSDEPKTSGRAGRLRLRHA